MLLLFFTLLLFLPVFAGGTNYDRLIDRALRLDTSESRNTYDRLVKDPDPQIDAKLLARLHSKKRWRWNNGLQLLVDRAPDVPILLHRLLLDTTLDDDIIMSAFNYLADYNGDPSIVTWLAPMLQDPRPDFRSQVAQALAGFGSAAEPALLQALYDNEDTVQFDVIEALGRCGTAASVKPLVELAEKRDWAIQFRVIDALDRLDNIARESLYYFAGSPDIKIREAAVNALANESDTRSRQIVAAASDDPEPSVRIAALSDLRFDPEPAFPRLYALLRDPDGGVRQAALQKLIYTLPGEEAIDLLIPLLDDTDEGTRGYAAHLLGEFRALRAGDALLARLRRPRYPAELIQALSWQRNARAIPELIALITAPAIEEKDGEPVSYEDQPLADMPLLTHQYAYEALVNIGEQAVDPLILAANSIDLIARRRALETLGALHDPRALNSLLAAAKDPDPVIHLTVLKALHQQGDAQAFSIFIEALKSPDETIRVAAAAGLLGCQDPAIIPPVAVLLRSPDEATRVIAAKVLANMDDKRVVPYCIAALRDNSEGVREAIVYGGGLWNRDPRSVKAFFTGLGRTADDTLGTAFALTFLPAYLIMPGLLRAVKSRSVDERYAASRALGMIHATRASQALVEALTDPDEDVREVAEHWLKDWSAPEALPRLRELARKARKPYVQLSAIDILLEAGPASPEIMQGLRAVATQTEAEEERSSAIYSLTYRNLPGSAEVLREVLCIPEPDPKADLVALGATKDPRVIPILLQALHSRNRYDRKSAAEGLGSFNDPQVVRELLAAMQAPENDDYIYESAARSLGKIKDPASVEPLIALLKDERMAMACIGALGEIGDERAIEPLRALLPDNPLHVFNGAELTSESKFFTVSGALTRLGDPRGVEALIEYLDALHNGAIIPLLMPQEEASNMRDWCISKLGSLQDPRVVDFCEVIFREDFYPYPKNSYAIVALGKTGGDRVVDVLLSQVDTIQEPAQRTFDDVVEALKTITADHLRDKLAAALQNPRWCVRLCAVLVLSDRTESWAAPLLETVLADPQPQVRMTARAMLEDKRQ